MAKTIQIQKVKSRKVDLDHYEVNYANMVAHFCPGEQRGWSAAAINKFLVANAQKTPPQYNYFIGGGTRANVG